LLITPIRHHFEPQAWCALVGVAAAFGAIGFTLYQRAIR
jgi:hypothetical protein